MNTRANLLDEIIEGKGIELAAQMAAVSLSAVKNRAAHQEPARPFAQALAEPDLAVIAEFKRRSPSAGIIDSTADLTEVVRCYEANGAAAVSVLTERTHFGGTLDDLVRAKRETRLPLLRKDFLFDEYQIFESRALGADAVLLIARILGRRGLTEMLATVSKAGLEALVEVHSEPELEDAVAAGASVIGINNRDLATLDVDLSVTEWLRPLVPRGIVVVSESGCKCADDAARLRAAGADAVLIGSALMSAEDISSTMSELFRRE